MPKATKKEKRNREAADVPACVFTWAVPSSLSRRPASETEASEITGGLASPILLIGRGALIAAASQTITLM